MCVKDAILLLFILASSLATPITKVSNDQMSNIEELQASLSETLTEMQSTLYEMRSHDNTRVINQMSNQVGDLTIQVTELKLAKDSLEIKVLTLETELNCIMGRVGTCKPTKCLNGGSLVEKGGSNVCDCLEGFRGTYCEWDVDECFESIDLCQNGGVCNNTYGGYTCTCSLDHYGHHCQHKYEDCEVNPCGNGNCVSIARIYEDTPHFQCFCHRGWEMDENLMCMRDINECEFDWYCDPFAVDCINAEGTYECVCGPGYTGSGKSSDDGCIEIDNCEGDPCLNGATCIDLIDGLSTSFLCNCTLGWRGGVCGQAEPSWCDDQPCRNGAECKDDFNGEYGCECPVGYKGELCENEVDVCEGVKCKNGGECIVGEQGYLCRCKLGFKGAMCEEKEDVCFNNPCKYGGQCQSNNTEYTCNCQPGFSGTNCQDKLMYVLTSCDVSGPYGPRTANCEEAYKDQKHRGNRGNHAATAINVDVNGSQQIYLPVNGLYRIVARGASGGSTRSVPQKGGFGALVTARIQLEAGYLKVAVGQMGSCDMVSKSEVCGGGGGTFIVKNGVPLIVTGGGGGAGDDGAGLSASLTTLGSSQTSGSDGGSFGAGGQSCPNWGGAGGAGFILSGEDGYLSGIEVVGSAGKPWPLLKGGGGESGHNGYGRKAYGGFGGGGRGTWSPGGGGGYSGGAGRCSKTGYGRHQKGGGGGGTLVADFAISKTIQTSSTIGHGSVEITLEGV